MAPEQLWGRGVDARTDVYAIGMALFECLTGEVPYVGSYPEVLVQVSNAPEPPSVREGRGDVSAALAVVIETALEKDPSARFQTAAELGRALLPASGLAPARSTLLSASSEESPDSVDGVESAESIEDDEPERAIRLVRRKAPRRAEDHPSVASTAHRRQFPRAPYVTPVLLISDTGSETEARSEEISEEGMLVITPLPFALGAPVQMRFASPVTGDMLLLDGSVRWTREGRGRSAIGLEFAYVPQELRGAVAQYIAMVPVAEE
jgi:serine/threonine protein kinase